MISWSSFPSDEKSHYLYKMWLSDFTWHTTQSSGHASLLVQSCTTARPCRHLPTPKGLFFSLFQSEEEQRAATPISLIRKINWNFVYGETQGDSPGLKTSACPQRMTREPSPAHSCVIYVTCAFLGSHPELQCVPAPRQHQHKERIGMNTTGVLGSASKNCSPKGKIKPTGRQQQQTWP